MIVQILLIIAGVAAVTPDVPARLTMTPASQPGIAASTMPAEVVPAPAEVVERFMQSLMARKELDAKAMRFIQDSRKKLGGEDQKDFINFALAVLDADFKKAMDLRDAERPTEAADAFEKLSVSNDPYIALNAAVLASADMLDQDELVRCLKMLQSVQKAHAPIERYTLSPEQFEFSLGYCLVHNLEYESALAMLEGFLRKYPRASERLRVAATHIVTELSRRMPRQLGDVRDLLAFARRQIRLGDTGDRVVERQRQAVAMLDDLIKDAEEQEKSEGSGQSQGGNSKGGAGGQQPGGGARQSQLFRGQTPETNLRRTQAKPGEAWGRMPPKEREAILQSMQRRFPGRYRELLEQYYKELAKESSAP